MADPIAGITRATLPTLPSQARGERLETWNGPTFAETLARALGDVDRLQQAATDKIGAFLRGEQVEMHEVMAAAEEAGIALELLVEMRNKLVEAYRTIVNMQS